MSLDVGMTGGTKGGAQRASTLRPRCVGEVDPHTATHAYLTRCNTQTICALQMLVPNLADIPLVPPAGETKHNV
jgi:hypothetical protein